MTKQQLEIYVFSIGTIMFIWGLRGVIRRKEISNRANYLISIGQLASGSLAMIIALVSYFGVAAWE